MFYGQRMVVNMELGTVGTTLTKKYGLKLSQDLLTNTPASKEERKYVQTCMEYI